MARRTVRTAGVIDRCRTITKSRPFEIAGTLFGLALVAWVLRRALADTEGLRFAIGPAVLAFLGFLAAWLGLGASWSLLVTGRIRQDVTVRWFRTQLLRYIPGAIWAPMARFVGMEGSRVSKASLLLAEAGVTVTTTAAVAGVAAGIVLHPAWFCLSAAGVVGTVAVGALMMRTGRSLRQVSAWIGMTLISVAWYMLASGWSQRAVASNISMWTAATAGLVGWLAGYVVVIAPGGLGAKEWSYVALLPSAVASSAAAGVLAARVLFVACELLVALATLLVARRVTLVRPGPPTS